MNIQKYEYTHECRIELSMGPAEAMMGSPIYFVFLWAGLWGNNLTGFGANVALVYLKRQIDCFLFFHCAYNDCYP